MIEGQSNATVLPSTRREPGTKLQKSAIAGLFSSNSTLHGSDTRKGFTEERLRTASDAASRMRRHATLGAMDRAAYGPNSVFTRTNRAPSKRAPQVRSVMSSPDSRITGTPSEPA